MQQVAKAIANLQKQGVREVAQLVQREGWYVEPHWMPTEQATALLNILEQVAPALRRVGVNNMLRCEQIPEEDSIELFIGQRWVARQPRARRHLPPEPFEGLGECLERTVQGHLFKERTIEYKVNVITGGSPHAYPA